MGTTAHLVAVGTTADAVDGAAAELVRLERLWSRFDPQSEISRIRAGAGEAVRVSPETVILVADAIEAWRVTDGRFDPTVIDALERLGYDRTFIDVADGCHASGDHVACAPPGCLDIVVDLAGSTVRVPPTVGIDVGGIAKGVAADRVVGHLLDAGAIGACVNIGGDLRVVGDADEAEGWVVGIEHPDLGEIARVVLADGAIATSSTRKRRWRRAGSEHHHVIDPGTGEPLAGGPAGVTVIASTAACAEMWATALLVDADVALPSGVSAAAIVGQTGEIEWRTGDGVRVAA